jgi:hypothetical protein
VQCTAAEAGDPSRGRAPVNPMRKDQALCETPLHKAHTPGGITKICGAVDQLTGDIYSQNGLEGHASDGYQEKVNKSSRTKETPFKSPLSGIDEDDRKRIWKNTCGSVGQATYVLGAFRRNTLTPMVRLLQGSNPSLRGLLWILLYLLFDFF